MSRPFGHLNNIIMLPDIVERIFYVRSSIVILSSMTISFNGTTCYIDDQNHLTNVLTIPNAIPKIVRYERTTPVVQIECTYRTNTYGIQMLQIVASTDLNIAYMLAYLFMISTLEADNKWLLHACLDFGIIVEPRDILTGADQAFINAIDDTFRNTQSIRILSVWHIVMNITAHHKKISCHR